MNLLSPVSRIMTKNLVTVNPDDELVKVRDIFDTHRIHHIPVVKDKLLVGMISKSDYLFFQRGFVNKSRDLKLERFRLKNHNVKELMTSKLATMSPDQKINVALEIFKENLFHAIPVVENGALVGIVTTWDIINNIATDKVVTQKYI